MNKDESILFGAKEEFGIEIMEINPKRYRFCFWVFGDRLGSFTRSGELRYSIKAYNTFTCNKESFYSPEFDHLRYQDIFLFITDTSIEDGEESDRRDKMLVSFGNQISSDTSITLLYKYPNIIFLVKKNGKLAEGYVVPFSDFDRVYQEYIKYYKSNNLV